MQPYNNVAAQFYGSGGAVAGPSSTPSRTVYSISPDDPDPVAIPLPGLVIQDGIVQACLNGLLLNPITDFRVDKAGSVSQVTLLLDRETLVAGDVVQILAPLMP